MLAHRALQFISTTFFFCFLYFFGLDSGGTIPFAL